jgi:hypothetical protein
MGIDQFSSTFAIKYGLRNALILSEICVRMQADRSGTSNPDLRERFPYLTYKKIREALTALQKEGVISGARMPGFSRELRYTPSEGTVRQYMRDFMRDVMEERVNQAARKGKRKAAPGGKSGGKKGEH